MINFEDLKFLVEKPFLPSDSIVEIKITVNSILENEDMTGIKNEICRIVLGKKYQDLSKEKLSSIEEELNKFIKEDCLIDINELDIHSSFISATFETELYYSQIGRLTEEDLKNIKSMKVKCIFGSFELI